MTTEKEMVDICKDLWKGGYYMGDPMDPMGDSRYGHLSFISSLYAIYQVCIRPYIKPDTNAIEIGPGRGAWTKCMLGAHSIWCLDTLPADHNGFWSYIGDKPGITYCTVKDFSCEVLPDDHFGYLFSYGTFCHIPWDGQQLYYQNLFRKLRSGAMCFVMYAEAGKYNQATYDYSDMTVTIAHGNNRKVLRMPKSTTIVPKNDKRWAWHNKWFTIDPAELHTFLCKVGYEVVNEDVGLNLRDPLIQFRKP